MKSTNKTTKVTAAALAAETQAGRCMGAHREDCGLRYSGAVSSSRVICANTAALGAFGFCHALAVFDEHGRVVLGEIAPGVYLDECTINEYWGSRSKFDAVGAWRSIVDKAIYGALSAITDADKALRECNHLIDAFAPRACAYTIKPRPLAFKRIKTVDEFDRYMSFAFEFAGLIAGEVYTYVAGRDA